MPQHPECSGSMGIHLSVFYQIKSIVQGSFTMVFFKHFFPCIALLSRKPKPIVLVIFNDKIHQCIAVITDPIEENYRMIHPAKLGNGLQRFQPLSFFMNNNFCTFAA